MGSTPISRSTYKELFVDNSSQRSGSSDKQIMRFEDIGITALYMALGTDWFKSSVSQAGITGSNPVGATIISRSGEI